MVTLITDLHCGVPPLAICEKLHILNTATLHTNKSYQTDTTHVRTCKWNLSVSYSSGHEVTEAYTHQSGGCGTQMTCFKAVHS
jgi:hypothetical protein